MTSKEYYNKNKEKILAQVKANAAKNKEKIRIKGNINYVTISIIY